MMAETYHRSYHLIVWSRLDRGRLAAIRFQVPDTGSIVVADARRSGDTGDTGDTGANRPESQ